MTQVIELLIRILMMFLVVVALHGTALGDIPPLPPEIPGTQMELPTAPTVAMAGILLSVAVAIAGVLAGKAGNGARKKLALSVSSALVLATIVATTFAYRSHAEHAKSVANWRPVGPVGRRLPHDSEVGSDPVSQPLSSASSGP